MSKKPRLNRNSVYKNGVIQANKLKKFVPTENSTSFVYRSSYEYLFMIWCENNESVIAWSSEPYSIPYFDLSSNRNRNYWIDFSFVDVNNVCWLVEVKPSSDIKNVKKFKKHLSTISNPEVKKHFCFSHKRDSKNLSKWVAAKNYCKKHNFRFILVDETFLKSKVA